MSVTISGIPIVDLPDLGAVTDGSSVVGEHAGSGRFSAPAFSDYINTKVGPIPTVRRFGATGNGVTDDTAAIQAAANYGSPVYLPPGTYLISSGITVTTEKSGLIGFGQRSIIRATFATGDIFTIGDGVNQIVGVEFRDLWVQAAVARSSGAAFHVIMGTECNFFRVYIGTFQDSWFPPEGGTPNHFDGYYFDRFALNIVSGGQVWTSNAGVKCRGNADQSFGAELSLIDVVWFGGRTCRAIWCGGGAGGVNINEVEISECGWGVWLDDALQPGTPNREVFLRSMCVIDSCASWGVNLESNSVAYMDISGAWVSGNGNATTAAGGIRVAPSAGRIPEIILCDTRIYHNYLDGVQLSECLLTMSGCIVSTNGLGTPGGHGVLLNTADVLQAVITGNTIYQNGNLTRGWGISQPDAGETNFLIVANNITGNGQGAISPTPPLGPLAVVAFNLGHTSMNSGNGTVPTGAGTVVISHGLAATPSNVSITPLTNQATAFYVGSITATQFTVLTTAPAAAPGWSFLWRASFGDF